MHRFPRWWKGRTWLLATFVVAATVSCTPEPVAPGVRPDAAALARAKERVAWVGEYHNEGLAFALERIKRAPAAARRTDLCRIVATALRDYHAQSRHRGRFDGRVTPGSQIQSCNAQTQGGVSQVLASLFPVSPLFETATDSVSPAAATLLYRAEEYIGYVEGADDLPDYLAGVESDAVSQLGEAERDMVLAAVNVAVSSADYWSAYYPEWEAAALDSSSTSTREPYSRIPGDTGPLMSGSNFSCRRWFSSSTCTSVRGVVRADVQGAVVGAVRGFFSGGLQGILSGAASEGLRSSGSAAAEEINRKKQ